jgi:flagellar biosynthesis GTPase FlhF
MGSAESKKKFNLKVQESNSVKSNEKIKPKIDIYSYGDGIFYRGEVNEEKHPHGKGKLYTDHFITDELTFDDREIVDDIVIIHFTNGDTYKGSIIYSYRYFHYGIGEYKQSTGHTLKGNFNRVPLIKIEGLYKYSLNNMIIEKFTGVGSYTSAGTFKENGRTYEGYWLDGKYHYKGRLVIQKLLINHSCTLDPKEGYFLNGAFLAPKIDRKVHELLFPNMIYDEEETTTIEVIEEGDEQKSQHTQLEPNAPEAENEGEKEPKEVGESDESEVEDQEQEPKEVGESDESEQEQEPEQEEQEQEPEQEEQEQKPKEVGESEDSEVEEQEPKQQNKTLVY